MAQGSASLEDLPSVLNQSLDYVFVVSRHGQRTLATRCTLLPKPSEDYGQLTAYGREQARALGRFLKDRYGSFLSDQPGEVLASHNQYQRTKDSVCSTIEGMGLPPVTPIQDKSNYDLLFDASAARNYQNIMTTPSKGHFKVMKNIVDFVCKNTGCPGTNQKIKLLCLDSLLTCVSNGYPIPDWARPNWDEIRWADKTLFTKALAGAERPMAAYVIAHILQTLSEKYEKGLHRPDKMHLFSTSDINLYSFVKLLNPLYDARPGFCSTLLAEISRDGDHMMAELLFAEDLDPQLLRLQKLSNPCVVADLMMELRHLLPRERTVPL